MVKIFKRRKLFDEDADWVPQKGRAFEMKTKMQKEEAVITQRVEDQGARKEQVLTQRAKEDPFRMTAVPPDIKYNFSKKERREEPKHEKMPYGWSVEEGKNQRT